MQRQLEPQTQAALTVWCGMYRVALLKSLALLECSQLVRCGVLWPAHLLPGKKGVAALGINAPMAHPRALGAERRVPHGKRHIRRRLCGVLVVRVVPDSDRHGFAIVGGETVYLPVCEHATFLAGTG